MIESFSFDPAALTFDRLIWPLLAGIGLMWLLTADWQPIGRPRLDLAARLGRADPETWDARAREETERRPVVHWRPLDALLRPLFDEMGKVVRRILARSGLGGGVALVRELERSFPGMTLERWWADKALTGLILGGALPLLNRVETPGLRLHPPAGWPVWLWLAAAILGFVLPDLRLGAARRRRQERIVAELVPLLDALVLATAAGLGLDQALGEVAREVGGVLGAELERAAGEVRLGQRDLGAALDALASRLEVPELGRLVDHLRAVSQQGLPLVQTLGVQVEALREAERLRQLARGERRLTLLLIPVALTVFPVMVLVVMFPASRLIFGLGG